MSELLISYGVYSYVSQNTLILPFQADFFTEVIQTLESEILKKIHTDRSIIGIILDLSKAKIIDLDNIQQLESVLKMAEILGVEAYLCGLRPDVTLTLVNLGYENKDLKTCLSIEHGITLINKNNENKLGLDLQEGCND